MILLKRMHVTVLPSLLLTALSVPVSAQEKVVDEALTTETFLEPAAEIAEAVMAPRHLNAALGNPSPDGRFFLDGVGHGPPSMASFAKPFYRLGGQQVDFSANRSRQLTTRSDVGLDVIDAETGSKTSIQIPDGAGISSPKWSPDGSQVGFLVHREDGSYVYVADPTNGRSRQVTRTPVLATLYTSFEWTPDSRSIVAVLLPEGRGEPPMRPAVPTGPQVRITTPETNRIRTYADLLEGPHEKDLVEYYNTGQLAVVDVQNRRARRIGEPAMVSNIDVSPDGAFARVSTMRRPFSYIVPTRSAGGAEEVWSLEDGAVITLLSEREVNEGTPNDTTDNGDEEPEKRSFSWRPDGQGLSFLQMEPRQPDDSAQADSAQTDEPLQGGGRGGGSRRKDRVFQWLHPFDSTSMTVVYESNSRLQGVRYSANTEVLFLTEQTGQKVHEYAVFLSDTSLTRHTIHRGERPRFGRGGGARMLTKTLANGASVVQLTSDGENVFLMGVDNADDSMDEGPKSYIDRVEIETGEKERVYESENDGVWENVVDVLNDDATRLLVTREGPTDVPDSYVRDVTNGEARQLTQNTDYTPDITNAQRRRYMVKRVDGFELAVNVTLPQDWQPGEKLPGMIWFYPREYTDQDNYNETLERYNKNRFPNVSTRSMEILVRAGYVVIQPDAPIVGETGRMNDNYVHDLRNNLAAVIDFLDGEGVIDRHRLGIGGHSYGAFSTFNAMVHTPFFKAGIAGDGNNNRTLTPFSFQSERRTLWQARDVYLEMSPFFHADHLSGALLMYHGEHDQNVGTFPIHSWRLYEAMEALGKTTSLYVYPYEDHGPATGETLLDLWTRWTAWLDKYVKNAGEEEEKVTTEEASGSGR
jgi:dipeptidyl aminopeptidase/acylaminoacyl peptidase